jgi:hypothetical protein
MCARASNSRDRNAAQNATGEVFNNFTRMSDSLLEATMTTTYARALAFSLYAVQSPEIHSPCNPVCFYPVSRSTAYLSPCTRGRRGCMGEDRSRCRGDERRRRRSRRRRRRRRRECKRWWTRSHSSSTQLQHSVHRTSFACPQLRHQSRSIQLLYALLRRKAQLRLRLGSDASQHRSVSVVAPRVSLSVAPSHPDRWRNTAASIDRRAGSRSAAGRACRRSSPGDGT